MPEPVSGRPCTACEPAATVSLERLWGACLLAFALLPDCGIQCPTLESVPADALLFEISIWLGPGRYEVHEGFVLNAKACAVLEAEPGLRHGIYASLATVLSAVVDGLFLSFQYSEAERETDSDHSDVAISLP